MIIFDAFLLWKQISHSIRRSIIGKKNLKAQNYNPRYDSFPKKMPKIIWFYWHEPIGQAPEAVRLGIESWCRNNPNWTVNVLSDNTVKEHITLEEPPRDRKIQWRADVIRIALLAKYGGVWIDATTFCTRKLDDWLPQLMESGFFAFPDSYPGRMMSNSFIAAVPGNYLVTKWSKLMNRYWQKNGKLLHYFWCMHLFEFIVTTDRKAAKIWNDTPKLHSKAHMLLKRYVTQNEFFTPIPVDVEVASTPFQKMSTSSALKDGTWLAGPRQGKNIDIGELTSVRKD